MEESLKAQDELLLTDKNFLFRVHLVALVVGDSPAACRAAAEKVAVEYESLAAQGVPQWLMRRSLYPSKALNRHSPETTADFSLETFRSTATVAAKEVQSHNQKCSQGFHPQKQAHAPRCAATRCGRPGGPSLPTLPRVGTVRCAVRWTSARIAERSFRRRNFGAKTGQPHPTIPPALRAGTARRSVPTPPAHACRHQHVTTTALKPPIAMGK
jgi:hypothetical protein